MSRQKEENLVFKLFGRPYEASYIEANKIINPLSKEDIKRKKARARKWREKVLANSVAAKALSEAKAKAEANSKAASEKAEANAKAAANAIVEQKKTLNKERANALTKAHNLTSKNKPFQIVRGVSLNTAPKKTLTLKERKEMNRSKKAPLQGIVENVQENVLTQLKRLSIQPHSKTPKKSVIKPKQRNLSSRSKPAPRPVPRPVPKPGPGPMVRPMPKPGPAPRPVPRPLGMAGPTRRTAPAPRTRVKPV
jgi:hypothetical protein